MTARVLPGNHLNTNAADVHLGRDLIAMFDQLTRPMQLAILASGVFFFFGIHNLLQEAVMSIEGFTFGIMLGYFEVLGVTICSYIERDYVAKERGRVAPISAYGLLTFCLMSSSSLSNLALNFINYPTKVVFRSCKLIPTMVVASVVHKKIFTPKEYSSAFAISLGLIFFAAADWKVSPSFHPIGLTLVSLSVCADAILPNAQERLFKLGSSRLEVTLYTNVFTLIAMTCTTLLSGDLIGTAKFAMTSPKLQWYLFVYTFIAYIAISTHMTVVKRFGGVTAVLVATMRKAMTLVLSFLIFPKAFSWFYVGGASLVLGGVLVTSLAKAQERQSSQTSDTKPLYKSHQSDLGSNNSQDEEKNNGPLLTMSTSTTSTLSTAQSRGSSRNPSPF